MGRQVATGDMRETWEIRLAMISLTSASQAIAAASELDARTTSFSRLHFALWRACLALLFAFALDIMFPWPVPIRGLFIAGWSAYLGTSFLQTRRPARTSWKGASQIAREIEKLHPNLDNAFIHALQFSSNTPEGPMATECIRREFARADSAARALESTSLVDDAPLRRQRRRLLSLLLFIAVMAALSPRPFRFELPRFFAFWADRPPFTFTDFQVLPGNIHIQHGQNVEITVQTRGQAPHSLELISGTDSSSAASLPLNSNGDGSYSGVLADLENDTWYYAVANTGRSARYWVRIDQLSRNRQDENAHRPKREGHSPASKDLTGDKPGSHLHGLEDNAAMPARYRGVKEAIRSLEQAQKDLARRSEATVKTARQANRKGEAARLKAFRSEQRDLLRRFGVLAKQVGALKRRPATAHSEQGTRNNLLKLGKPLSGARAAMRAGLSANSVRALSTAAKSAAEALRLASESASQIARTLHMNTGLTGSQRTAENGSLPEEATMVKKDKSKTGTFTVTGRPAIGAALSRQGDRHPVGSDGAEQVPSSEISRAPRGENGMEARYPPEYRGLVRDYFKAVAGGK